MRPHALRVAVHVGSQCMQAHCGRGACREEGRGHLALCQPLLDPFVNFVMACFMGTRGATVMFLHTALGFQTHFVCMWATCSSRMISCHHSEIDEVLHMAAAVAFLSFHRH